MRRSKSAPLVIAAMSLYLLLPLVLTLLYSFFTEWKNVLPEGPTLRYYSGIFAEHGLLLPLLRTLGVSFFSVALCTLLVLLAMYAVTVHLPGLDPVMQLVCTVPYAIQGIILAISVLSLYTGLPKPFSDRRVMLVLTYCVVILPYLYRGIRNSLNAIDARRLMEAAAMLGAGSLRAFFTVVVPNILSGITVSFLLAVSILFGDFAIVNILAGSYYETAQIYLYRQLFESGQRSSAVVCILFGVTLLLAGGVIFLSSRYGKDRRERSNP